MSKVDDGGDGRDMVAELRTGGPVCLFLLWEVRRRFPRFPLYGVEAEAGITESSAQ